MPCSIFNSQRLIFSVSLQRTKKRTENSVRNCSIM
nr:MAG TPA: hypothetical protein [Caudoviricetes sp.]